MAVLVREQALANIGTSGKTVQVLNKVVGVADLYGWAFGGRQFQEVHPNTAKKLLTGDANADKDVVAAALEPFVGRISYACDDESDAVAVGIAWLIQKGLIDNPLDPPKQEPEEPAPKKTRRKAKAK